MPLFNWTGNPFVDTGLMVILHLANKSDISELTYKNVTTVFGDGRELASMNAKLKSFTLQWRRANIKRRFAPARESDHSKLAGAKVKSTKIF